jgi:hypothetical protein
MHFFRTLKVMPLHSCTLCPPQCNPSAAALFQRATSFAFIDDSLVLQLVVLAPFLLAASVIFLVRNIKNDLPM